MPVGENHGRSGAVIAGKYRLMTCVGHGGMGSIWCAEHVTLGAPVAIKLINPSLLDREGSSRDEILSRFSREARAAAAIRSPHVVQILDHGIDGETPFMVLELLDGETLHARLGRVRSLPFVETTRIVTHVCRALTRAHEAGIVHRDLTPANVFLVRNDDEEIAKILDFGLVKVTDRAPLNERPKLTELGRVIGTPYFMSPEQVKGIEVDHRADLWAVAVLTFRCICGRLPFESTVPSQLFLQICVEPLPVPSRVAAVPEGFDAWFAKAVARDPERRFQSAREMAEALRALTAAGEDLGLFFGPPTARRPAPPRRRLGVLAGATAAAVLALAGALVVAATLRRLGADAASAAASADAPPPSLAGEDAASSCPDGMVLVPGGSFLMGSNDRGFQLGQPSHRVELDAFCIDVFEVTAADYKACSDIGECKRPGPLPDPPRPEGTSEEAYERLRQALSELCTFGKPGLDRHPINCVSFRLAEGYCRFRGKRVPTEAEWEYAARSAEGRAFPWGDAPSDAAAVNLCGPECTRWEAAHGIQPPLRPNEHEDGFPATAPVGSFPKGATKHGVHELLGNVAEWTADGFGTYGPGDAVNPKGAPASDLKVLRGGAFTSGAAGALDPGYRDPAPARASSPAIGFRCAKDR